MPSNLLGLTLDTFAVLGASTVTNTGPTSVVGNLGVNPGSAITGFPPGVVTGGTIHASDAVALQAQNELTNAYNVLAGLPANFSLTGQDLGGLTLTAGVYNFTTLAQLTGTLTLDGQGNPNARFVFQVGTSLTTASGSRVVFLNGASDDEVYWQVGSSATLGTTTQFAGNILALASVTLNTGSTIVCGRALASNGAVTLDSNTVSIVCPVIPGSVSGRKIEDLNGDGILQAGEPGIAGVTLYIDANGNGLFDAGEVSTLTDAGGNYRFGGLVAGTYRIRQAPQLGLIQTTTNPLDVTLSNGQDVAGVDFGDFRPIAIAGLKFNDLNGNGVRDAGDTGRAGVTIFLDTNGNGILDAGELFTVTDANGAYSFAGLGAGTYRVREQVPGGSVQTTANPSDIVASSGSDVRGVLIGNFQLVSIAGIKFNDLNGNGVRDAGDTGLAGVTVFLDTNGNGILDAGERSTVTDVNGAYSFAGLGAGTYRVRETVPGGSVQTTINPSDIIVSSGTDVGGVLMGDFQLVTLGGLKFNDLNGNGVRDTGEPGLAGVTVFLDTNGNGILDAGERSTVTDVNGAYSFPNVGPGTFRVREAVPAGSIQTTANPAAVTTQSGANVGGILFGNFQMVSLAGIKFNDLNGNGIRDTGEPGLAGVTVFLDTNGNGILDAGERSTVTGVNGAYSFSNVGPGTFRIREAVPAGSIQTTANPAAIVTRSGTNVGAILFGNFQMVSLAGLKFNDLNGNGIRDRGEPGLAGVTIFLDANRNGILDAGERSTVTDGNGAYNFANVGPGSFRVREASQLGWVQMTNNPADVVTGSGLNVQVSPFGNAAAATLLSASKLNLIGRNAIILSQQASFVESLYESLLNRAPDLAGLRYYVRLLQAGFNAQQVFLFFRRDFRV